MLLSNNILPVSDRDVVYYPGTLGICVPMLWLHVQLDVVLQLPAGLGALLEATQRCCLMPTAAHAPTDAGWMFS